MARQVGGDFCDENPLPDFWLKPADSRDKKEKRKKRGQRKDGVGNLKGIKNGAVFVKRHHDVVKLVKRRLRVKRFEGVLEEGRRDKSKIDNPSDVIFEFHGGIMSRLKGNSKYFAILSFGIGLCDKINSLIENFLKDAKRRGVYGKYWGRIERYRGRRIF